MCYTWVFAGIVVHVLKQPNDQVQTQRRVSGDVGWSALLGLLNTGFNELYPKWSKHDCINALKYRC
jgi:hypothetical protein